MKILNSTILILAVVKTVCASPAGDSNAVPVTPALIGQLAEEIRTNHPALLAAYARTNAAAASVAAVRTWEDPMARIGGMAAREEMRAEDGDLIYGAEQKLPLWGKPKLARRVAQTELATEAAKADYQFQLLRLELAKSAFRLALAHAVVTIGEQDLGWVGTMIGTVEGRYQSGQATLVDVLQIENERAKRQTQLESDRNRLAHEQLNLNRILNRKLEASWPVLSLPTVAEPVIYDKRLVEFAMRYEPKIKLLRQQISQTQAAVDLAQRQRMPDVNVGFEGRNYTGDGSFRQGMMILSMNLPWVNTGKYRQEVKREEARQQAAEYDLADYQLSLQEEVHLLAVKIDAARREALLYQDEVIPRSESALESARFGWEANRNTFRDLLEARRLWLEGRLMHARAVSEQYQMLSELVLCCGIGDLEALQMLANESRVEPEKKTNEK